MSIAASPQAPKGENGLADYLKRKAEITELEARVEESDKAWRLTDVWIKRTEDKISGLISHHLELDRDRDKLNHEISEARASGAVIDGNIVDVAGLVGAYRQLVVALRTLERAQLELAQQLSKRLTNALLEDANAQVERLKDCRLFEGMTPEQIEGLKKFGIDASACKREE